MKNALVPAACCVKPLSLESLQSLSQLFWALGEITQATTTFELNLEAEAPNMLHYLAAAARQQAADLRFQASWLSVHTCLA